MMHCFLCVQGSSIVLLFRILDLQHQSLDIVDRAHRCWYIKVLSYLCRQVGYLPSYDNDQIMDGKHLAILSLLMFWRILRYAFLQDVTIIFCMYHLEWKYSFNGLRSNHVALCWLDVVKRSATKWDIWVLKKLLINQKP